MENKTLLELHKSAGFRGDMPPLPDLRGYDFSRLSQRQQEALRLRITHSRKEAAQALGITFGALCETEERALMHLAYPAHHRNSHPGAFSDEIQTQALQALRENPQETIKSLAERFSCAPHAIAKALDDLQRAGKIRRLTGYEVLD